MVRKGVTAPEGNSRGVFFGWPTSDSRRNCYSETWGCQALAVDLDLEPSMPAAETFERGRLGDAEIVRGQQLEARTAQQGGKRCALDEFETAPHDEGHGEPRGMTAFELVPQGLEQGRVATRVQPAGYHSDRRVLQHQPLAEAATVSELLSDSAVDILSAQPVPGADRLDHRLQIREFIQHLGRSACRKCLEDLMRFFDQLQTEEMRQLVPTRRPQGACPPLRGCEGMDAVADQFHTGQGWHSVVGESGQTRG
jgi:hypothetical protein